MEILYFSFWVGGYLFEIMCIRNAALLLVFLQLHIAEEANSTLVPRSSTCQMRNFATSGSVVTSEVSKGRYDPSGQ